MGLGINILGQKYGCVHTHHYLNYGQNRDLYKDIDYWCSFQIMPKLGLTEVVVVDFLVDFYVFQTGEFGLAQAEEHQGQFTTRQWEQDPVFFPTEVG